MIKKKTVDLLKIFMALLCCLLIFAVLPWQLSGFRTSKKSTAKVIYQTDSSDYAFSINMTSYLYTGIEFFGFRFDIPGYYSLVTHKTDYYTFENNESAEDEIIFQQICVAMDQNAKDILSENTLLSAIKTTSASYALLYETNSGDSLTLQLYKKAGDDVYHTTWTTDSNAYFKQTSYINPIEAYSDGSVAVNGTFWFDEKLNETAPSPKFIKDRDISPEEIETILNTTPELAAEYKNKKVKEVNFSDRINDRRFTSFRLIDDPHYFVAELGSNGELVYLAEISYGVNCGSSRLKEAKSNIFGIVFYDVTR